MGKTTTPKFRIELQTPAGFDKFAYMVKESGAATVENAKKFRDGMNASFKKGGSNYHITEQSGVITHYCNARIINQSTGQIVVACKAPMFEVVD